MKKLQNTISITILASEASHVFCCVLPSLFSILSLLSGLGIVGAMPLWIEALHHMLHGYEVPMIFASAFLLALGWGLHVYSEKIDCHDTGCGHGPCGPKKKVSHKILYIATILFVVNVTVYFLIHR